MKYLNFILILILLSGCSSSGSNDQPLSAEEKVQKTIGDMLKKNLPHPETYQAVSFGKLDSVFTQPSKDTTDLYMDKANYYMSKAEEFLTHDFKRSALYSDSSTYYSKKVVAYLHDFTKELIGYRMSHSYQASSASNLMTKETVTVYLDTTLQIVSLEN
jgi:hypothetical protein